ncbi:F-box domain-containing protein [Favolaschia claudopus]|uniref:F-box domain-containing protein n=1 Tax=Favolaschia claudopus TaxID=2862362 RepID=A0AAW0EHT8_9AGAR
MPSLALSRLLAVNEAPLAREALEIRAIRDKALNDLRQFAGGSTFRRNQEASLRETIRLCSSILSPIRRLSAAMLSRIFLLCLPHISEARNIPWYEALEESPWILGHVSRYGRAVALATPGLWSSILIQGGDVVDGELYSLGMLESSAGYHLRLRQMHEQDEYIAERALQALVQHSTRWKTLRITASQLMRLAGVRGRLPILETLSVYSRDDSDEEADEDYYSCPPSSNHFAIAPELRSLHVDNAGYPSLTLPWAQLTHYEALGTWAAHIDALQSLPNLESCSLVIADEVHFEDPFAYGIKPAVRLTKLRQLRIMTERFFHAIEEEWVWPRWLRLPALTELAIPDGLLHRLPDVQYAIHTHPSLRKLHIIAGCPEVAALRRVLRMNASITELLLTLDGYGAHSRDYTYSKVPPLMEFLTLKPRQPDLFLPQLETLVIQSPTRDHEEMIGTMVASRWGTTPLRSVYAVDPGVVLEAKLDSMKAEGLRVFCAEFLYRTESRCLQNDYGDSRAPFQLD